MDIVPAKHTEIITTVVLNNRHLSIHCITLHFVHSKITANLIVNSL